MEGAHEITVHPYDIVEHHDDHYNVRHMYDAPHYPVHFEERQHKGEPKTD